MTVYYVDYENVHAGVDGIDKLSAEDTVRVFYSPKADTMRIAFVEQALAAKAKIDLISVDVGTPNALDFQLVAWLYSELPTATEEHVIISNDHGYDAAVRMGVRLGLPQIRRAPSIAESLGLPPTQLEASPSARRRSSSRRGGQKHRGAAASSDTLIAAEASGSEEAPHAAEAATGVPAAAPHVAGMSTVAPVEALAAVSVNALVEAVPEATGALTNSENAQVEVPPAQAESAQTHGKKAEKAALREGVSQRRASQGEPAQQAPSPEPVQASAAPSDESHANATPADETSTDVTATSATISSEAKYSEETQPTKPARSRKRRRSAKAEAARADAVSKTTALLAEHEVVLLEDQLNVVVKAAQSAINKQEFYRTIIQKLGQKQGLSVYGQVKQLFKEIVEQAASASNAVGFSAVTEAQHATSPETTIEAKAADSATGSNNVKDKE